MLTSICPNISCNERQKFSQEGFWLLRFGVWDLSGYIIANDKSAIHSIIGFGFSREFHFSITLSFLFVVQDYSKLPLSEQDSVNYILGNCVTQIVVYLITTLLRSRKSFGTGHAMTRCHCISNYKIHHWMYECRPVSTPCCWNFFLGTTPTKNS